MTKPEDQMKFEYLRAAQRSPKWFKIRLGKVTASRLVDWLSVSKAKATLGKPLKARTDYERELLFERTFGKSFGFYVTPAMQDGIDFEDFARRQYEKITGNIVEECGCWYSDEFVASPDGMITGEPKIRLVEIKVLRDNSFTDVLTNGVPDKHWKQIQGQLWATKAAWCDYVAINLNTRKMIIIRVTPDEEFHDWLELAVPEPLTAEPFDTTLLHDFVGELPDNFEAAIMIEETITIKDGWSA